MQLSRYRCYKKNKCKFIYAVAEKVFNELCVALKKKDNGIYRTKSNVNCDNIELDLKLNIGITGFVGV